MSVSGFFTFLAQVLFVALSAVAISDYVRRPTPQRRDFALLCCALGIPLGLTLLDDLFGIRSGLLDLLGALVLFSQPYFLFRTLQYFRPSRPGAHRLVLLGMFLAWVVLFVFMGSFPLTTQVIIFGYCVVIDAYCAFRYYQGARITAGTLQRRLSLITVSAGLFTIAVAGNVVNALLPASAQNLAQQIGAVGLAVTALSALLYYLAFVPPRWLRRAWQFEELRDYFARTKLTATTAHSHPEIFRQLSASANQALHGLASAVVRRGENAEQWQIVGDTTPSLSGLLLQHGQPAFEQAWQQRQPISLYIPDWQDNDERSQMASVGARTWLLAPIQTPEHLWGILIVLRRDRSLFIDDDLGLLELFTQQCATMLENYRLIDEIQGYSDQLELRVNERTAQLEFLASASRILAESFDYVVILKRLAQLVVPQLADWCSVDVVDEDGRLQRLAVVHRDPQKQELALELQRHFPPTPNSRQGAYNALQTGKSILTTTVTSEVLATNVSDPKLINILHKLGCKSAIAIPLLARGRSHGAFTLVIAESDRRYDESDLALVEDLARRAALLIDNAKLYRETQQINTELEQRVQERTAHLMTVNKELEAFSYSVSHDLRAPLRAVDGFSQALLEDYGDDLDEMGQDFLGRIRSESQRMGQLIDDLIGLSHFTRTEMHLATVDLSAMACDIVARLQSEQPDRPVTFTIQEKIIAQGDERLLRVALQNLIGNAWKFTAKTAQPHIEFGVYHRHIATNGTVNGAAKATEYFVRDNGAGFNMAYVGKLFGAFQRLHAMTEYHGTGIGLATVQRIVRRHGGSIRAEGEVNKGATFYFTLGEGV